MRLHPGHAAFLAIVFLLIAVLYGSTLSGSQAAQSGDTAKLSNLTDSELKSGVIQLERTGCYGDCPSYKLAIYGDGKIEYSGENYVKFKGTQQGEIAVADFKRLVSEFDKARYVSTDQYTEKNCHCGFCTDMPTVITEIQVRGSSQRVEHYRGCRCAPKGLWDLEEAIDKIAGSERWTGEVSKQGPRRHNVLQPLNF